MPNTDPRFGWRNAAAVPGGIDVGRYLEAVTPYLSLLAWWNQSQNDRIRWWKQYYGSGLYGTYPGDSVAATKSPAPQMLPAWPAQAAGDNVQYHWGFCSAELAQWAQPADTQIGFAWVHSLDESTLHDASTRHIDMSQVERTPCDKNIDNGTWCSIAYYVDCTRAQTQADTAACVGWNDSISNRIDEDYHWGPDHRSSWDKLKAFVGHLAIGSAEALGGATLALDVANLFIGVYNAIQKVVAFIANASTAFDKLVNELKNNAIGLVTSVLQNYNTASAWDPGRGGFLARYALMAGLGFILAAFMFLGAIRRAMDSGKRDESKDLWLRLLKTFALIVWAPALFQLLATSGSKATADIVANWTGGAAGGAVQKLTGVSRVTDSIPGGAIMGFVLFLLLFLGALGLWVGLMIQRYGMELGATLIALVAGAYVHPRWQRKVAKAVWVVVGLILAKPLTMIVLGAAFGVIDEGLSFGGSPTKVLAGLTLATIGVLTAGLAPFAALRWAPLLPTAERSHDHHRGGGGVMSGAVLGAAGASFAARASGSRQAVPARARHITAKRSEPGQSGRLTESYDRGVVGRARGAGPQSPQGAVNGVPGRGANATRRVRGRLGGVAAVGGAAAAQAAQAGLVRGRALAEHQTPEVDLPEDGER